MSSNESANESANETASEFSSIANHFLVAMPKNGSSFFAGSVVYLCGHTPDGAMGLVINKPSPIRMRQLFESEEKPIPKRFDDQWVSLGGPVQTDRGFFIHTPIGKWNSSIIVNDDIAVTSSRDIVTGLLEDEHNAIKTVAAIGYCSWTAGQLEKEIADDFWLIAPADYNIMFDLPFFKRYDAALRSLGVSAAVRLSGASGHA